MSIEGAARSHGILSRDVVVREPTAEETAEARRQGIEAVHDLEAQVREVVVQDASTGKTLFIQDPQRLAGEFGITNEQSQMITALGFSPIVGPLFQTLVGAFHTGVGSVTYAAQVVRQGSGDPVLGQEVGTAAKHLLQGVQGAVAQALAIPTFGASWVIDGLLRAAYYSAEKADAERIARGARVLVLCEGRS